MRLLISRCSLLLCLVLLALPSSPAQETLQPVLGPVVLQQGPVHEALMEGVRMSPETVRAGAAAVPSLLREMEEPRAGSDGMVWAPGYWSWEKRTEEFVWVPGFWRRPPPGREWRAGEWLVSSGVAHWRSGFWADKTDAAVMALREPAPEYRGRQASQSMLPAGTFWVPGVWRPDSQGNYQWTEGYAAEKIAGMEWVPAHHIATVQGWIFVDGYWDYPIAARGKPRRALRWTDVSAGNLASGNLASGTLDLKVPADQAYVPLDKIYHSPLDGWRYDVTGPSRMVVVASNLSVPATVPLAIPSRSSLALTRDGTGSIYGVVRKGDLKPDGISVRLIGGRPQSTETTQGGKFAFTNIPFGDYWIIAEGPVQNYGRSGAVVLTVNQESLPIEIELE